MPDGGGSCDLACRTKIVVDGDLVAKVFETSCEGFEKFIAQGGQLKNSTKILDKLIAAEDAAFEFQRALLEGMGYHGPWPKCLS
jgi:hypothetical protein